MKIEKRTFLKLCGIAAVTTAIPGIKLFTQKVKRIFQAGKARNYPGRIKQLSIRKTGKRGDWAG